MTIQSQFSLKGYNTFGLNAIANEFIEVTDIPTLKEVLSTKNNLFILGGGSNMLLTKNIDQTVVHINLKGITTQNNSNNHITVTAQAGENWHDFVRWCISQNYGGLENLSLIPGNVGSCPIQNIGAYGVEVKDTIKEVTVISRKTLQIETFTNKACKFGYRESIFKNEFKDQYVILSVTFLLTTQQHLLNTSYGTIQEVLTNKENPTLTEISDAVIQIRNSKLPNPKELGNSGSFFKNPVISTKLYQELIQQFPDMPSFPVSDTQIKIPAGWLIEKSGFKGYRSGDAGVHQKQALVLVNYGNATGKEIIQLANKIQNTILEKFKIQLSIEVNVF